MKSGTNRRLRSRAAGALRRLGRGLTYALGAVLGLIALLLVCVNLPPVRAFVAARTSATVAGLFAGKLEIRRIGAIGWGGVSGVDALVFDAAGRRVLDARGLSISLPWPRLLWDLLVAEPHPLTIHVGRIALLHADVALIDDGSGSPSLAGAFAPRTPSTEQPSETKTVIELAAVEIDHAWVHGALSAAAPIDLELWALASTLRIEPQVTSLELERVRLAARGLPRGLDAHGELRARARLGEKLDERRADARFHGRVAGISVAADSALDGRQVTARLHAVAPAGAVTKLAPGLQPRGSTELAAKVGGRLPDLSFSARLLSLGGRVEVTGAARIEPELSAHATVTGHALDASAFVATAPQTHADFELVAEAALRGQRLDGSYRLKLEPATLAGETLPAVDGSGRLSRDERGTLRASGLFAVHEPGAPTSVDYELELGAASWVEARSETRLLRPARLVELAGVSAAGVIEARARYDLERRSVSARVDAALPRLVQGRNQARQLRVLASASGSLRAPAFELQADAEEILAAEQSFRRVTLRASGSTERARVEGGLNGERGQRLRFSTLLELAPEPALKSTELVLTRRGEELRARVAELSFGKRVRLRQLELEGAGRLEIAALTLGERLEQLEARAQQLDLSRLARVLGVKAPLDSGTIDLEVKLERRQGKPTGYLRGRATAISAGVVENGRVALDLAIAEGRSSGSLEAELFARGHALVTIDDVPLIEPPYTTEKLERLTGRIAVRGDLDLRALEPLIERELVPLERARGRLELDATLERSQPGDGLPSLRARLETRGLELVGKRAPVSPEPSGEQARRAAPWQVRELDVGAELSLASNGKVALDVRAHDRRGELLELGAESELPRSLRDALDPPLQDLPLAGRLRVPARSLENLPDVVPLKGMKGRAALELELSGTPRSPRVELSGRFDGLRPQGSSAEPLDVTYRAWFSRDGGQISADAFALGRRVGELRSAWQGDASRLGEPPAERGPLRARALIAFDRLPLGAIPGAQLKQIEGALSGRVTLEGLGDDARLNGHCEARPFKLGQARFKAVIADLSMVGRDLRAVARLEQPNGGAQATLQANYDWGARLAPKLAVPLDARLEAKNLRLAGLALLAPGTINELDGTLDGEISGRFGGEKPSLAGSLRLRDGVLQEPTVGQRFHDIEARVKLEPGVVKLEALSARGSSGRLTATAAARLYGLDLRDAEAHLRIEKNEKIPVTLQGVALGDAYGKIDASLRMDERRGTEVRVDVPELTLELPESGGSGVQELDAADFVRVGTRQKAGEFVVLPLQPLEESAPREPGPPTRITVKLGPGANLKKGNALDVRFGGETQIEIGDETRVSGQIRLSGGKLDLRGKLFDVERGVITFDGQDPSNPTLLATARWDSPAGYTVYVEYSGTAQQGQLTLSSEPSLTEDQILSLLLFGNPDGSMGGGDGNSAVAAFGVAGGAAVRGLNRTLSKITELDLDARIDTSTGSARPELVLQLTPRLSARVTRSLGEPAPGQPPDRTFATLDLRLGGRWSLATMVGDRGASALDLIWRHRY